MALYLMKPREKFTFTFFPTGNQIFSYLSQTVTVQAELSNRIWARRSELHISAQTSSFLADIFSAVRPIFCRKFLRCYNERRRDVLHFTVDNCSNISFDTV
jgi:hypothetical protein